MVTGSAYLMCRPPLCPPTTTHGRFVWLWSDGLPRPLPIEHQFDVIFPGRWYARGAVEIRQHGLTSLLFRFLNTPLDFADGIDIFSDLRAVPRTQFPLKARHVFGDPVENATVLSQLALAVLCRSSVTKEAFENHPRICFGRKRVRGRRP